MMFVVFLIILFICCSCLSDTYALIVASSEFFRNIRHTFNALSIYQVLQNNNVPSSNIILMVAGNVQCNARNTDYGKDFSYINACQSLSTIDINYQGMDVTLDSFIGVLTNKLPNYISLANRLNTDANSKVIVFVNGHGGENFLKFRVTPNVSDNRKEREELTSEILYSTITDMFYLKRYKEILIILDTCQAASLIPKVLKEREFTIQRLPPHSTFFSSSSIHEESFSYGYNPELGAPVEDRFVHQLLKILKDCKQTPLSVSKMMNQFSYSILHSTAQWISSSHSLSSICNYFS